MKSRIISGAAILVVTVLVLFVLYTPIFPIFFMVISALATHEVLKAVKIKNKILMAVSVLFAFCVPLYFTYAQSIFPAMPIIAVYILLLLAIMLKKYDITRFEHVAIAAFASILIPSSFSIFIYLRDIPQYTNDHFTKMEGIYLILSVYVCSWITDVFAYFTGRFFGKHKLSPKISPNKTIEGAIGGIVFAALVNILLLFIFNKFFFDKAILSYWMVVPISVVLSIIGMLGDLSASTIKRNYDIKDFGALMPGHGGIMDRFDSVLFVLPVIYFITQVMTYIN